MKKVFSTFLFFVIVIIAHSQTTYYWVGGATGLWTASTSWNTSLDGSGTPRNNNSSSDIYIFDGTNVGGATPTTSTVVPDIQGTTSFSQLKLQNGANVVFQRSVTGSSTFTILGDGTTTDDFTIDPTSTLKIT